MMMSAIDIKRHREMSEVYKKFTLSTIRPRPIKIVFIATDFDAFFL